MNDYCVVAKRKDSNRYVIVNHEPLDSRMARKLSQNEEFEVAHVSKFKFAQSMVNFFNNEVKSDLKPDDELLADLEQQISRQIRMYAMLAGRTGKTVKISDVFVGRENYEVQVTLGE